VYTEYSHYQSHIHAFSDVVVGNSILVCDSEKTPGCVSLPYSCPHAAKPKSASGSAQRLGNWCFVSNAARHYDLSLPQYSPLVAPLGMLAWRQGGAVADLETYSLPPYTAFIRFHNVYRPPGWLMMVFGMIQNGTSTPCIDWNLLATVYGGTRRAFCHHVRAEQPGTVASNDRFPHFLRLPLELQRHIFTFCDCASLFQLMHVSSTVRDEAKKLFWSESTTRYHVYGYWLFAGGHPAYSCHDPESLAYMQYIEVDFDPYTPPMFSGWERGTLGWILQDERLPTGYVAEQFAKFWKTLRSRFPSVIDVVLSTEFGSHTFGSPPPPELTKLAESCPEAISVSVSCLLDAKPNSAWNQSRHIWQRIRHNSSSSSWRLIDSAWTRQSISPPMKKFAGPVGSYISLAYNEQRFFLLSLARPFLMIQATVAYYLHFRPGPFVCPITGCGQEFKDPSHWVAHFIEVDHNAKELCPPPCEQLQDLFKLHDASLARLDQRNHYTWAIMQAAWGEEGTQEHDEMKRAFLQQLQDDPLYAGEEVPEESSLWRTYQKSLDGTWDEYTPSTD